MKPIRFATAVSAITLASMIAGCAVSHRGPQSASDFGGKASGNIGLAMQALAALNANDVASATSLAERAVQGSVNDAGFRALLGNTYFAGGRFASAETAYRDSLALLPNQPQVVLKLALVQIAQGKNNEALSFLAAARPLLDASDYGLALALAGQPRDAVNVLDAAARERGADSRLRQNLALAYALSGDWTQARAIAAQDLTPDIVDQRVQQWMSFAKPARAADQVAALTGVVPAAADPGQPTRLALRSDETRTAVVAPAPAPAPAFVVPAPAPVAFAPALAPAPVVAEAPQAASVFVAEHARPELASRPLGNSVTVELPAAMAEPAFIAASAEPQPIPAVAPAAPAPVVKAAAARVARLVKRPATMPRAFGRSTAVVQLGAYGSPQRVAAAWNGAARRYSVLRAYAPVSARFNSQRGLVYRLSVRGFASVNEASGLCAALRRAGAGCFVRSVAGDAPVQIASR
jgi:D-alanyl-D-alanine carboxypeptidase